MREVFELLVKKRNQVFHKRCVVEYRSTRLNFDTMAKAPGSRFSSSRSEVHHIPITSKYLDLDRSMISAKHSFAITENQITRLAVFGAG